MRTAIVVLAVLLSACRRDATTEPRSARRPPRPGASAPSPGQASRFSDEELVAFTRWQRDYMDLMGRYRAELDAVGNDDPDLVLRDPKAIEARAAEVVARQTPIMKAHWDRAPLKGERAELLTEALGGIFHFGDPTHPFGLIIARDEVRLEAARRRFGAKVIDDIVSREPLILAALQEP